MKHLIFVIAVTSLLTVLSVFGEAWGDSVIPAKYDNSFIEFGFVQFGEPEPKFLVVSREGRVLVYQIPVPVGVDRKVAVESLGASAPEGSDGKELSPQLYLKRLMQIVESERFFNAEQPVPKPRCRDRYSLRVRADGKEKTRSGCANQMTDPYAAFSQALFREAYLAYMARLPASVTKTESKE